MRADWSESRRALTGEYWPYVKTTDGGGEGEPSEGPRRPMDPAVARLVPGRGGSVGELRCQGCDLIRRSKYSYAGGWTLGEC
jgi:hypothetical protein